jgi:hypothetical protein
VELPRIVEERVPPVRLEAVRVAQDAVVPSLVKNLPVLPDMLGIDEPSETQDAADPSVVRYLPLLPVWLGRLTGAAAHLSPAACALSAVRR